MELPPKPQKQTYAWLPNRPQTPSNSAKKPQEPQYGPLTHFVDQLINISPYILSLRLIVEKNQLGMCSLSGNSLHVIHFSGCNLFLGPDFQKLVHEII